MEVRHVGGYRNSRCFLYARAENLQIMGRWLEQFYFLLCPAIEIFSTIALAASLRRHRDRAPFYMIAVIFAATFGVVISSGPCVTPSTIDRVAASERESPSPCVAKAIHGAEANVAPVKENTR